MTNLSSLSKLHYANYAHIAVVALIKDIADVSTKNAEILYASLSQFNAASEEVHKRIADVFNLLQYSHKTKHKNRIIDDFKAVEIASDKLFALMDRMLDEEAAYSKEHISHGDIEFWD